MDLDIKRQIMEVPDLRHRVRQLRWFKTSFRQHARLLAQHYDLAVSIDDTRLTEAFLNWAERFSADQSYARLDRRDFLTFTAGLLLRELLALHPVDVELGRAGTRDEAVDGSGEAAAVTNDQNRSIIAKWPEGFIATNYCLCVLAAVLEQEGMLLTVPALANDLRTWMSYRENVVQDPAQAIAFLDLFTGVEPNWYMPDSVSGRAAMTRALAGNVIPSAPAAAQLL